MIVIGITGSIATGKTTVSKIFMEENYKIFDADKVIAEIYENDIVAIKEIEKIAGEVLSNNKIDKIKLKQSILKNLNILEKIEKVVHPIVKKKCRKAIVEARKQNSNIVLDIPLLFEANFSELCHLRIVTWCDDETQRIRILKRGLDLQLFKVIKRSHFSQKKKMELADFCLSTNGSCSLLKEKTIKLIKTIEAKKW